MADKRKRDEDTGILGGLLDQASEVVTGGLGTAANWVEVVSPDAAALIRPDREVEAATPAPAKRRRTPAAAGGTKKASARKPATKKASAKKAGAKKSSGKSKAGQKAGKAATRKTSAKKTATKKASAKKTAAKKANRGGKGKKR